LFTPGLRSRPRGGVRLCLALRCAGQDFRKVFAEFSDLYHTIF